MRRWRCSRYKHSSRIIIMLVFLAKNNRLKMKVTCRKSLKTQNLWQLYTALSIFIQHLWCPWMSSQLNMWCRLWNIFSTISSSFSIQSLILWKIKYSQKLNCTLQALNLATIWRSSNLGSLTQAPRLSMVRQNMYMQFWLSKLAIIPSPWLR